MIELEKIAGDMWSDEPNTHVIVHEDWDYPGHAPGFYVRDEDGDVGVYPTFAEAFERAQEEWGEVTLAPANRLRAEIEEGRTGEIGHFLLEYLADYGAVGIDARALARRVFERIGGDEEARG